MTAIWDRFLYGDYIDFCKHFYTDRYVEMSGEIFDRVYIVGIGNGKTRGE